MSSSATAEAVRAAFLKFDRDNNGTVSQAELAAVFAELGEPLTHEEAEEALRVLDAGRSGKVSLSDFLRFWFSP